MSNVIPLNARDYLSPRYWPLWLVFGLLRLISLLPIRWTQAIGSGLGVLVYRRREGHLRGEMGEATGRRWLGFAVGK